MASESAVKWTAQQLAGITTTGVNLLVSAAAGSGKTAVLSERCAYLVCDAPEPCAVDELLVVTFTEATASQMKSRIAAALQKRGEALPENARLQAQIAQIDRTQVSTLHGFCSRLLRQHFHLVNLDPGFVLLDGSESKLLKTETVRELFADRYDAEDGGTFEKLTDVYADGNDESIQGHVLRTYELLCSVSEPNEWLSAALQRLAEVTSQPLRHSALGKELASLVRSRLSALVQRCQTAAESVSRMDGLGKTATYIRSLAIEVNEWAALFGDGDFDALAAAISAYEPGRQPVIPSSHPQKPAAQAAVESIRDEMGKKGALRAIGRFSEAEWRVGVGSTVPFARVFLDLVAEFRERYQRAKSRIRSIDFADLERFALDVLRTRDANGSWVPSEVARSCHARFAHVLVDEYQDINAVQDEILRLVSRECVAGSTPLPPNLFCVGDVKQSIYGFRLAEPERFLNRYFRYRHPDSGGQVIDLQQNFRSRAPLLDGINALFEKLMTREAADIDYDASQRLVPGATFPQAVEGAFSGAPIELHLLPVATAESDEETQELDRTEREALLIGTRISEMVGSRMIADGAGGYRPIEYRDIVILLRATAYKGEQIAQVLRRSNIPVHRESGTGYFQSPEIRDVLALLHLLDNSKQDLPLVTVLRSPLVVMRQVEDKLARIRLAYPDGEDAVPFHDALVRYAAEQSDDLAAELNTFLGKIDGLREVARRRPLAELIWTLLEETGYLAFCAGLEHGDQRVANLLHLHDRAKQFGANSGRGLYKFLRSLDRLKDEADLGMPSVLGDGEDVVRIMTIHKSKGLEFPVVFIPDLGKRFNQRDSSGRVLIDRSRYLGLPAFDEAKQVRYPSLASVLVKQRLRQQAIAEELRVLYVAMTRAKEHLVMMGTCDEKALGKWETLWSNQQGPFSADTVLDAGTPLEWVAPVAIALRSSPTRHFDLISHTADDVAAWTLASSRKKELALWQLARAGLQPLDPAPALDETAEHLKKRLGFVYAYADASAHRAAIAATTWAKGAKVAMKEPTGQRTLPLPRNVQGEEPLNAADRGTATHLVLQHLKFDGDCAGTGLLDQIAELKARKLLTTKESQAVDLESVTWFASTDLGQRIRAAAKEDVIREIPFSLAWSEADEVGLDRQMIRGRVDLLIREGNECVVVDYKTDNLVAAQVPARAATDARQVQLYRDALHRLTKLRVSGVYLVFLTPRVVHEL